MRRVALLLAIVLVGLATAVPASAAGLHLTGAERTSSFATQRCDDAVATTTTGATATRVSVSGIAAECAGLSLQVRVYAAAPAAASSPVTVPEGGGSVTVTVPAFTPTTAHQTYVTIDGWPVRSTWSYSAPSSSCVALLPDGRPQPGGSCVVTGITMATPWGSPRQTNGHIRVTSSSAYLSFTVDLRPALPSGWNWSTSGVRVPNQGHVPTPGMRCASLPAYAGTTNRSWSSVDIYLEVYEDRSRVSGLACAP